MLANKNENIKTAYEILRKVSRSKEARMAYEARQAEIMDQLTREKTAEERGRQEGREQGKEEKLFEIAKNALMMNLSLDQIEELTGLSKDAIKSLKQ